MPQLGISLHPKFNSEATPFARRRALLIRKAPETRRRIPVLELAVGGLIGFAVAMAAFWFGTR